MDCTKKLIAGTILSMILASNSAAQMRELPGGKVELKSSGVIVPLLLVRDRPTVELSINGKGPFRFILDTGASGTLIAPSLAEKLNLAVVGDVAVGSPVGGVPVPAKLVQIPQLTIVDLAISDAIAVSVDMPQIFSGDNAPQGVLSPALFSGLLVSLDYPQNQISIWRGELPSADKTTIFDYDPSRSLPSVPLSVAGLDIEVHIDSGSPGWVTLPKAYAAQLPLASKPVDAGRRATVDAEVTMLGAKLDGIVKLGRYTFTNPELMFGEQLRVGNIGSKFLRQFKITLDRKNHRVRFEQSR